MSMQITKVGWDGDKLMAEPISESEVYKPEPVTEWLTCPKCAHKAPYTPIKAKTLAEDAERITKQARTAIEQMREAPVAWVERWFGSGPDRGWWIWESGLTHGNAIAYIGESYLAKRLASLLVEKHNAAITRSKPTAPSILDEVKVFEQWCFAVGLMSESHGIRSVSSNVSIAERAWNARAMLAANAPMQPAALSHANPENTSEASADAEIASHAKRLALELECLLLSCDDTAAASKWWTSAHEALEQYQADVDRLYPQDHVSPLGKD